MGGMVTASGAERRRILHVFRAPLGGLFRHVVDLVRLQAAAGHDVGIFCDATTGGERATRTLAELAPILTLGVTRVPMHRNPHPGDLTALLAFNRLYRATGADVLHGHGSKGGLYARLALSHRLDGRTIRAYTPHGGSFNYRPGTPLHRLYMAAEGLLARRTDVFLFESLYVAGRFRDFVGETDRIVRMVHNGLCDSEFAPVERVEGARDLVYIGELREAKGVQVLLEAVARLRTQAGLRLTLLVVGSGPTEADLREQARRLGIADAVAFAPPGPIRGALAQGEIMVIPSLAESLPYVILEAAAAAQPIVSTNVGGIPEIVGPGANDLVPPNDPAALAEAILRCHREAPDLRAARAAELSASVRRRFSMRQMAEGVLDGYAAARAARGAGAREARPVKPSVKAYP